MLEGGHGSDVEYRNESKGNLTFGSGLEEIYGLWRGKSDVS